MNKELCLNNKNTLSIENNMNPIINDMITMPSIEKFAYASTQKIVGMDPTIPSLASLGLFQAIISWVKVTGSKSNIDNGLGKVNPYKKSL